MGTSLLTVDIIIPCHELYSTLEKCLASLFNGQQFFNKVILVDDDSSELGTLKEYFFNKYPDITYLRNKERTYYSGTVNHGLKYATSKYVLVLNSDTEVVTPDCFGVMIKEYEEHEEVKMLSARAFEKDQYGVMDFALGYAYLMEREFLSSLGNLKEDGYFKHFNSDLRLYQQINELDFKQGVSSALIKHEMSGSGHLVPKRLCKILPPHELIN